MKEILSAVEATVPGTVPPQPAPTETVKPQTVLKETPAESAKDVPADPAPSQEENAWAVFKNWGAADATPEEHPVGGEEETP